MNKKVKLLIVTQKVDENDDILGFFHRWIEEFAKNCEQVTVICLQKGEYHLPSNVKVLSLGKEENVKGATLRSSRAKRKSGKRSFLARFQYTVRFYRYIWRERKNYDSVFVHMNQIYIILGGLFWRLLGKKVSLWYAHGYVSFSLRIAEKFSSIIFTSTRSGFRLASKKIKIVGQGIDTDFFIPLKAKNENSIFKIISVGRISPIKDYGTLIKAVDILAKNGIKLDVVIVGGVGLLEQEQYLDSLKKEVRSNGLENIIHFVGAIPNKNILSYLQKSDLFVNTSFTGSLDKAILEAMATGLPVLTCNEALNDILMEYRCNLMFYKKDTNDLFYKIIKIINMKEPKRRTIGKNLRKIVVGEHGLCNFVKKIVISLN